MATRKQALIRGTGKHRRTEGDYMGILLDTVTLDDWRDVVAGALQAAKAGDAQARGWLAQYLVGKAGAVAPTAMAVQVNQWSGTDPLAARIAKPLIDRERFPSLHGGDAREADIQDAVAAELARKLTLDAPAGKPHPGESGDVVPIKFGK